jgi:hypothetical protein
VALKRGIANRLPLLHICRTHGAPQVSQVLEFADSDEFPSLTATALSKFDIGAPRPHLAITERDQVAPDA